MTAPTLTGFAPSITFAENTVNETPQLLDANVTFADAEGDFNGGYLTVTGLLAEDIVSVSEQGLIELSGANVIFDGVIIGTLAGGAGVALTVMFSAAAYSNAIDALIQSLAYANSSDTPAASRDLVLNVVDAAGEDVNLTSFAQLIGAANPLDGIDVSGGSAFSGNAAPSFVDLDGDGDLDIVVGEYAGTLVTYENTTPRGEVITLTVTADAEPTHVGSSAGETINGTNGFDIIHGLRGNDQLGLAGDDFFNGGEGNDLIFGSSFGNAGVAGDIDTVIYDGNITDYNFLGIDYTNSGRSRVISTAIVVTDDVSGGADGLDEGKYTLVDIDFVQFADGNVIDVNAIRFGTAGADVLVGDASDSAFIGGLGGDTMTGDGGIDTFYFNSLNDSTSIDTDVITDFTQGEDEIVLFEFDIDFSDLTVTDDGTDTTVAINGTGFELDLNGVIALTQDDFIF